MKKALFALTVFLVSSHLFAQGRGGTVQIYGVGEAFANYVEKTKFPPEESTWDNYYQNLIEKFYIPSITKSANFRRVAKLTEAERRLCWKALSEWDYKAGETYNVNVFIDGATSITLLLVTITSDGESFYWLAWSIW